MMSIKMPKIVDHDQQRERIRRVFWNEDHFEVHTQDERKPFAAEAKTFTTDVVFESDQLSSLTTGDMTGRVLHSLTEMQRVQRMVSGVCPLLRIGTRASSSSEERGCMQPRRPYIVCSERGLGPPNNVVSMPSR